MNQFSPSKIVRPVISVVVPVYKGEGCLEELYRRLTLVLSSIVKDYEILLVEDCGGDNSWIKILELSKKDPKVRGLKLSRNFGQHYSISAGLDISAGDWVVVMDCDLQDRPEEIPFLYKKALEGYDVVLAKRGSRKDSLYKRLTSWTFYKIFSYLADLNYDGDVGNFRIISRKVVVNYNLMREQLRFFGGLVSWMGFNTASINIQHDERYSGESSYTLEKLIKLALDIIIAYSDKPLKIAVKFGFFTALLAFFYGSYIIYKAFYHDVPILGWSSIMASIYFIGGIVIMNIGIIGIYLGKTFDEVKRRPLYIISESTDSGLLL
jgi:polyisoprenyl-phosphate glycosyltransferase